MTPLELAHEGHVDQILSLSNKDDVYYWLCIARDLGHDEADDEIWDLMENHGYDEAEPERMANHLTLAGDWYLGKQGLEPNPEHGKSHLHEFLNLAFVIEEDRGWQAAQAIADQATPDTAKQIKTLLQLEPHRQVIRCAERLMHLHELNLGGARIPTVILESEAQQLREATEAAISKAVE